MNELSIQELEGKKAVNDKTMVQLKEQLTVDKEILYKMEVEAHRLEQSQDATNEMAFFILIFFLVFVLKAYAKIGI